MTDYGNCDNQSPFGKPRQDDAHASPGGTDSGMYGASTGVNIGGRDPTHTSSFGSETHATDRSGGFGAETKNGDRSFESRVPTDDAALGERTSTTGGPFRSDESHGVTTDTYASDRGPTGQGFDSARYPGTATGKDYSDLSSTGATYRGSNTSELDRDRKDKPTGFSDDFGRDRKHMPSLVASGDEFDRERKDRMTGPGTTGGTSDRDRKDHTAGLRTTGDTFGRAGDPKDHTTSLGTTGGKLDRDRKEQKSSTFGTSGGEFGRKENTSGSVGTRLTGEHTTSGKPSFGDKIIGTAEKVAGTVTGNPDLKERGQERKAGDYNY